MSDELKELLADVNRLTDGPPGHPRCIVLAARYCPHLARDGERTPNDTGVIAYA